jgi:hypothetical protein
MRRREEENFGKTEEGNILPIFSKKQKIILVIILVNVAIHSPIG